MLTAAVVYFVVVLPMKAIMERRKRGEEAGPAEPTQVELLRGDPRPAARPAGRPGRARSPRPGTTGLPGRRSSSVAAPVRGAVLQVAAVVVGRVRRAARPSRRRCRPAPATGRAGCRCGGSARQAAAGRAPRAPRRPAGRPAPTPATASLLPRVPEPMTTRSAAATAGSTSTGQSAGQADRRDAAEGHAGLGDGDVLRCERRLAGAEVPADQPVDVGPRRGQDDAGRQGGLPGPPGGDDHAVGRGLQRDAVGVGEGGGVGQVLVDLGDPGGAGAAARGPRRPGRRAGPGRSVAGSQVSEPSWGAARAGRSRRHGPILRHRGVRVETGWPHRRADRPGSDCRAPGRHGQDGAMIGQLHSVVLDAPDAHALATFYADLLGMEVKGGPGDDWVVVTGAGYRLAFQQAPDLQPPDWPDPDRPQQFHLDIRVADIDEAEPKVLALGARRLPGGGGDFRVYADPVGHPFCLVWDA